MMAHPLIVLATAIKTALEAETDFDSIDTWWGPPRLALDVSRADTYIRFDQLNDGSYGTEYHFEIKLISRGGVNSNSPVALVSLYSALLALFDGTTLAGYTSTILLDLVERVQDETLYTLTVKFL